MWPVWDSWITPTFRKHRKISAGGVSIISYEFFWVVFILKALLSRTCAITREYTRNSVVFLCTRHTLKSPGEWKPEMWILQIIRSYQQLITHIKSKFLMNRHLTLHWIKHWRTNGLSTPGNYMVIWLQTTLTYILNAITRIVVRNCQQIYTSSMIIYYVIINIL
jgi:hypothetical protein